jgi:hypothetical protein
MADYDEDPYGSKKWGYRKPKQPKPGWLTMIIMFALDATIEALIGAAWIDF